MNVLVVEGRVFGLVGFWMLEHLLYKLRLPSPSGRDLTVRVGPAVPAETQPTLQYSDLEGILKGPHIRGDP